VRQVLAILIFFIFAGVAAGQKDTIISRKDSLAGRFYILQNVKRDGVTMPEAEIKEVTISGRSKTARRNEYRGYERMIYNIKKVYPYAKIVRSRLSRINEEMKNITDERTRRNYLKDVEKNIFSEYEDDIRDMTITQGRLLIKLIDRETQNTSYALIRDYRGKFSAAFWQGIARIFGTNLKEEYDPDGNDALIEFIINGIDEGRL
jgi:hypothetical protein